MNQSHNTPDGTIVNPTAHKPERCPSCGTVIRPTGECRCSD